MPLPRLQEPVRVRDWKEWLEVSIVVSVMMGLLTA